MKGVKREETTKCESIEVQKSIKDVAEIFKDQHLKQNIAGVDFIASEVHYHETCKIGTWKKAKGESIKSDPNIPIEKKIELLGFEHTHSVVFENQYLVMHWMSIMSCYLTSMLSLPKSWTSFQR